MSEMVEVENETTTAENTASEKVKSSNEAKWYVAHTYSGYENKVKSDIEKTIENRKLQDQILEVAVPVQDVIETKNGSKKTVSRKLFPGYVLINMYMNDVTWYIVRNTRGVTGFVGPESKPVPLTEAEMRNLGINVSEVKIDVAVGDTIKVVTGAWEGNTGEIKSINEGKQTVTIEVDIFGRATSVEIGFADIQKL
ncbi:MAG: transcription termination/antitermination factor NusG [Lachnospiraceae bacterium]|nr:transcription termination/antitermination factor NusG [Lachnospiraceae bacterium]